MNNSAAASEDLVSGILSLLPEKSPENHRIVLFPAFTQVAGVSSLLPKEPGLIKTGGQNCHWEEKGAFTGEVSASMLKSAGAEFVLIGHSERRLYFHESNEVLSKKIKAAANQGLCPVYCCGETLSERKSGKHFDIVRNQIEEVFLGLPASLFSGSSSHVQGEPACNPVIAYEPVWAIGTGETATPDQAQEMHCFIRGILKGHYGEAIASSVSILYGGSCNPSNALNLFSNPDIDGGLIGGASLKAADFVSIFSSLRK